MREYRELVRSRVAGYELRYVRSVLWRDVVAYILWLPMRSMGSMKVNSTWNLSVFLDCVTRWLGEKGYRFFTCRAVLGHRIFTELAGRRTSSAASWCPATRLAMPSSWGLFSPWLVDEAGNIDVVESFLPDALRRSILHSRLLLGTSSGWLRLRYIDIHEMVYQGNSLTYTVTLGG